MLAVSPPFYSYEGEGDLLGAKTVFCRHPGEGAYLPDLDLRNVEHVYVNVDKLSMELVDWANTSSRPVSLEVYQDDYIFFATGSNVRLLITCDRYEALPYNPWMFIKIRIQNVEDFEEKIDLANRFAKSGYTVLAMPEFQATPAGLGELMQGHFDRIAPGVRLMPPVQILLQIR